MPEEEVIQRRQSLASSIETLLQAKAEDQLLKARAAGNHDKSLARVEVERNRSLVEQYRTELERLQIRAPVSGHVLKVDVRRGEYVGTPPGQPLIMLGDLERMHVRVDIDEQDIPRFHPGISGTACIRGNASRKIPLSFVRVEPFVQPKTSLIGNSVERVDTRPASDLSRWDPRRKMSTSVNKSTFSWTLPAPRAIRPNRTAWRSIAAPRSLRSRRTASGPRRARCHARTGHCNRGCAGRCDPDWYGRTLSAGSVRCAFAIPEVTPRHGPRRIVDRPLHTVEPPLLLIAVTAWSSGRHWLPRIRNARQPSSTPWQGRAHARRTGQELARCHRTQRCRAA